MSYTYLLVNLACVFIPLVISFHPRIQFNKEWRFFLPANVSVAAVFLVWDYFFTELGVWGFNPDYLIGVYVFNLPVEELLFFICIPYACAFTYFVFTTHIKPSYYVFLGKLPLYLLMTVSLLCFLLYYDKLYTGFTAVLLFITLVFTWIKRIDINRFVISYLIIIPFFFISNGILTGSFLAEPIVWYNNEENLGIRMFTIPIEDAFYGFLLIFTNLLLYEKSKSSSASHAKA